MVPEAKTLRDDAANAALTGMLCKGWSTGASVHKLYAEEAYKFGDAMMEARKK
jgi:hypothetical protein